MKRRLVRAISFFVALLFIAAAIFLWKFWQDFMYRPFDQGGTVKVYPGEGLHAVSWRLTQMHLIKHPLLFEYLGYLKGANQQLKAGEYAVKPGMTPVELLLKIASGQVLMRNFTMIEGWTFDRLKKALKDDGHLKHILDTLTDAHLLEDLGAEKKSPEGLFFPDTYRYTWGDTDLDLLCRSYQEMEAVLKKEWLGRAPGLPYRSPYEALIMASLIEKETAKNEERSKIAGVLLKRLQLKMRLQVDPSVMYGLRLPKGALLTREDLKKETPYNTYLQAGLPPTPIDNPGLASIVAALHPEMSGDLYYVSRNDGTHQFSKTYAEHLKAVKKWQRVIVSRP